MSKAGIAGKIVVTGRLKLLSPLLICSGIMAAGNDMDMQVLKDKAGIPFIPEHRWQVCCAALLRNMHLMSMSGCLVQRERQGRISGKVL